VGNFYVLNDFIVVDMAGEVCTQIILERTFLATSGCKVDVKVGRITIDVGTCHVEFNFFEVRSVSVTSFLSDKVPNSHGIDMDDVWCCIDPPMFDWVSNYGPGLDYAKVEFAAPILPDITEDRPSAFNEGSLNAYCRFAQLLRSLPPVEEVDLDFNLGIESIVVHLMRLTPRLFCMRIPLFGAT